MFGFLFDAHHRVRFLLASINASHKSTSGQPEPCRDEKRSHDAWLTLEIFPHAIASSSAYLTTVGARECLTFEEKRPDSG